MTNKKNLNEEEQKSLSLFKTNFSKYSEKTVAHDISETQICDQSYLIEDFIQKKLSLHQSDSFVSHMANCDRCTEVVSVLISTKALDILEAYDTSISQSDLLQSDVVQSDVLQNDVLQSDVVQSDVVQSDVLRSDVSKNLWIQAKDGLMELKENIKLSIQNGFQNMEAKLIPANNLVFRGEGDMSFAKPQYIKLALPNDYGEIKLSYIQTAIASGKIKIDIEAIKDENSFIDILDSNEILLKSFEGKKVVEYDVSKEDAVVQINMKYKLKLDLF
jgi:hypothetical protein